MAETKRELYFLGIIDVLTFYNAGKKAAHAAKTVKHGVSQCKIMWALIRVITFLICQKIFYIASAIKTILLLFFLHLGIEKHVNRQHMSKAEDADPLGKPRNAVNDHRTAR